MFCISWQSGAETMTLSSSEEWHIYNGINALLWPMVLPVIDLDKSAPSVLLEPDENLSASILTHHSMKETPLPALFLMPWEARCWPIIYENVTRCRRHMSPPTRVREQQVKELLLWPVQQCPNVANVATPWVASQTSVRGMLTILGLTNPYRHMLHNASSQQFDTSVTAVAGASRAWTGVSQVSGLHMPHHLLLTLPTLPGQAPSHHQVAMDKSHFFGRKSSR